MGRIEARIAEAARLGYKEIYISAYNLSDDIRRKMHRCGIDIIEIEDIAGLCRRLFKNNG